MAVLAIVRGHGITRQMYDDLRRTVNWESKPPAGAIFHAAGFDEAGDLHAADVWESSDLMNEFFSTRLLPAMKDLQIPPPEVTVYELANANAFRGVQKFLSTDRLWMKR